MGKPEPRNLPDLRLPTSDLFGVYVHIPFCSAICNYCNFNRGLYDEALKTRYVEALLKEIDDRAKALSHEISHDDRAKALSHEISHDDEAKALSHEISHDDEAKALSHQIGGVGQGFSPDTIYFGGGTPSLLDPADVRAIVGAIRSRFAVDPDSEVTLETNPETVDRAKLERFREAGVNRLSFGVQSFHDEELRRLGRIHSADRARLAVREARAAGFDNVSLDLMMWLPGQSVASWLESVDRLIDAAPDHASLYLLELYPNAPLKEEMARAGWSLAPDDDAAEMYLTAMSRLEQAGLQQYEISNVACTGRESRHNLKYWTDGEWLAFGCGAHATVGGVRTKNVASTTEYIDRVDAGTDLVIDRRVLTLQERLEEALFTGLRLNVGVNLDGITARYGIDVWATYGQALTPFVGCGWLVRDGPRLRLTREGMLMANEVMAVFV